MVKFFVRTTGERELDSSYSQIEYELLIDKDHQPLESFLKQYEYIKQFDSVVLEDDLVLCKNFKERIMKIINEHPDDYINFFCYPVNYFQSRYSSVFTWQQCVYRPKSKASLVLEKMKTLNNGNIPTDDLEGMALFSLRMENYQPRPCIVQHIDNNTLIQTRTILKRRITPYFIDWFEKNNITYEFMNSKKLNILLKEVEVFENEHR